MTNELIAGYANYASTEAIIQEQHEAAYWPSASFTATYTCTLSISVCSPTF
ncbi:hypothetical protein ACIBF6_09355 [Streptosporangium amethystogenes]|uniref:hypothetical protein n=1 Tax=Streptosporangium amethystogenes TaxID=2002 RepID=UPI0037971F4C